VGWFDPTVQTTVHGARYVKLLHPRLRPILLGISV
jgi:hypothetical protein